MLQEIREGKNPFGFFLAKQNEEKLNNKVREE